MTSPGRRILRRLREITADIDYAQQRLFEIRTGIPLTRETKRALARAEIGQLDALYAMTDPDLTLRVASSEDAPALARLAELDDAAPLAGPVLLAEVEGSPRAAVSLSEHRAIADPFTPTEALLQLLMLRARQLEGPASRRSSGAALRRGLVR